MTILKVSKLPIPTMFLLFFCVGLITSVLIDELNLEFLIANLLLYAFIALALLRKPKSILLLALGIGILFSNLADLSANSMKPSGCTEAKVASGAKKFNRGFVYKLKGGRSSFLVFTKGDELGIFDEVKVCIGKPLMLKVSDQRYILSQFKLKNVYEGLELEQIKTGSGTLRYLDDLSKQINR